MKLLILLAFTLSLSAEEAQKPDHSKELAHAETIIAKPWQSLSLAINSWMGDYWSFGPSILLQKSVDETVVVSWTGGPEADRLPVIVKILSKKQGEELYSDLCRIYRMGIHETSDAEKMSEEEIEAHIAKTNHSPAYHQMVMRIADSETKTNRLSTELATWDIRDPKGAEIEFHQIVSKFRPPSKKATSE